MSQATHGGNVEEFCRRYGFAEADVLDFSSNLNWFLPEMGDSDWLRLKSSVSAYGEAEAANVAHRIAEVFGYEPDQVLPTAGSIEAIYLAAQLFRDRRIAIGVPGFSDYERAFAGASVRPWTLQPDDEVLDWADVIVFGSPNNPTGLRSSIDQLQEYWRDKIWLVDETFVEFSKDAPTAPREDTILFRSLTKSWRIPGLRLGFALTANEMWKREMAQAQPPWSVSALAQAWSREHLTEKSRAKVNAAIDLQRTERNRFQSILAALDGVTVLSSDANFFLIELPQHRAAEIRDHLAGEGILVRTCDDFRSLEDRPLLRLAVRKADENDRLTKALERRLAKL